MEREEEEVTAPGEGRDDLDQVGHCQPAAPPTLEVGDVSSRYASKAYSLMLN